jgi:hypothetical protein
VPGVVVWSEALRAELLPRERGDVPRAPAASDVALYRTLKRALRDELAQTAVDPHLAAFFARSTPPERAPVAALVQLRLRAARQLEAVTRLSVSRYGLEASFAAALAALGTPGGEGTAEDLALRAALVTAEAEVRARCEVEANARWPDLDGVARHAVASWLPTAQRASALLRSGGEAVPPGRWWSRCLYAAVGRLEEAETLARSGSTAGLIELVRTFGAEAMPLLLATFDRGGTARRLDDAGRALSALRDDEVARRFAQGLGKKSVLPLATSYFGRFPELAARHLATVAARRGRRAEAARALLARAEQLAAPPTPGAPLEALRRLPWRGGVAARLPMPVDPPPTPAYLDAVAIDPESRARIRAELARFETLRPDETTAVLDILAQPGRAPLPFPLPLKTGRGRLPPTLALELWQGPRRALAATVPRAIDWMLHEHGAAALDGALARFERLEGPELWTRLLWIDSPKALPWVLELLEDDEAWPVARAWLRRFPDAAAAGAVPRAVGPAGAPGRRVLWALVAEGQEGAVRRAAEAHPAAVRAAVEGILEASPPLPRRPPALDGVEAGALPVPVLATGEPLDRDDFLDLLRLAAAGSAYPPPPIWEAVRAGLEEGARARLARALEGAWALAGRPEETRWMKEAGRHLAPPDEDAQVRTAVEAGDEDALVVAAALAEVSVAERIEAAGPEAVLEHGPLVERRLRDLERAMVEGTFWEPARHRRLRERDPLFRRVAPRLLWFVRRDRRRVRFRVAEDGTAASVDDRPIEVFDRPIGLVHPIDLPRREAARWEELFGAYEVLPPFEQLGRPVHRLTEEDRRARRLRRHLEAPVTMEELELVFIPRPTAAWAAARSTSYRVCEVMAGHDIGSPRACSPRSSAATRSSSAAPRSRSSAGSGDRRGGPAVRLRGHRARRRQRPRER